MFETSSTPGRDEASADIACHEVSEDGVNWRPFDPAQDRDGLLHKRIVFAPPGQDD